MYVHKGGIKAWLLFIVIIIIVFGALFYLRDIYIKAPAPEEEVTEEVKKTPKPFAIPELTPGQKLGLDNSALKDALSSGSLEDCEKIKYDEELKQRCLDNLSYMDILKSGDESQCEKLSDPDLRQQCYDKIYYSAALDTFNVSLCNKISDEALKQSCTGKIQVVMGRTAEDESVCDVITDPDLKQDCLDNYYLSSSVKDLNEENCENISDPSLKERCTVTIAQNLEVIELSKQAITDIPESTEEVLAACTDQECEDEANYELANEKKDLTYCYKISDPQYQQRCVITQSKNINQYYLRQALAIKDASICDKITNTSLKELCKNSI